MYFLNFQKCYSLIVHISVWLQLPCQDTLHILTTGQTRTAKASSEIPPFELAGPREWWSQARPWIVRLQTQRSCGAWMNFLAIRCNDSILWKAHFFTFLLVTYTPPLWSSHWSITSAQSILPCRRRKRYTKNLNVIVKVSTKYCIRWGAWKLRMSFIAAMDEKKYSQGCIVA